jgi:hypothetical protein
LLNWRAIFGVLLIAVTVVALVCAACGDAFRGFKAADLAK